MALSFEVINYGYIKNETIIKIFGDEMTFNDLKNYYINLDDETDLRVDFKRTNDKQLVRINFNDIEVMEKTYSIHHSCDMFYYLSQLEYELNLFDN